MVAKGLAALWWSGLRVRRAETEERLRRYLGLDATKARVVARGVFAHWARVAVDEARMSLGACMGFRPRRPVVHLRGAALPRGGAVLACCHTGHPDACAVGFAGAGRGLTVVTRRVAWGVADALWRRYRERAGLRVMAADETGAAGTIVRAAREGAFVAMMIDQHFPAGFSGLFLGAPAGTDYGAALLALRAGVPYVPVAFAWESAGHIAYIGEAITPPAGSIRARAVAMTQAAMAFHEAHIRAWPEQWLWLHRRWKTPGRRGA